MNRNSLNNNEVSSSMMPRDTGSDEPYSRGLGIRHVQALLLFLMLLLSYALRVNMSVAIVTMVDNSENPDFDQYEWGSSTQSIVLSSFFWGYVVAQLPAGPMARRYGSKILLLLGMLIGSIFCLLLPLAASLGGWETVVAFRVLLGISQGFVYPCTHSLIVKWAPIKERGLIATSVYAGAQMGTVIMLAISGVLAASVLGWPSIFYVSGGIGVIWSIFFFIFGANTPAESKHITSLEREYIESSCGVDDIESIPKSIPWKSILTSIPFWALLIVHCGNNWGTWTLFTNIPTYMKNVLDFDIKENALLSAVPYLTMWVLSFVFSFIADFLRRRKMSAGTSRKLFNSIGHWVPMIMLIGLGFVTKDNRIIAVLLLTLCVGMSAATYVGYLVNHMDLSPNFAGTLMGVTNFVANGVSILAPLLVGFVVKNESDPLQWRIVFFISAGIYFVGNLLFVIFGQGKVQSWNST